MQLLQRSGPFALGALLLVAVVTNCATGGDSSIPPADSCGLGQSLCSGTCVSTASDPMHCGGCGRACATGESCEAGACSCGLNLTDCGGSCKDLNADGANCGSCGNVCSNGLACSLGQCSTICAAMLTRCGTSCVDTSTDVNHCGGCDAACQAGEHCVAGSCSCGVGETLCGASCTNTSTDAANCGSCGRVCMDGECVGGECSDASSGSGGNGSGSGLTSDGSTTTGGSGGPGRELGATCYPVCASAAADPDGDGWGFEGDVSCVVQGSEPYQMGVECTLGTGSTGTGSTGTGSTSMGSTGMGSTSTTGGFVRGEKFVGNITTFNNVDTDGKTFANYWDQITPENAGKWGSVQRSAGAAYNWSALDAIYAYAQQHNLVFKQHAFVWGSQQPSGSIGESDVRAWMREFCSRYPDTQLIDVVNEPPPHTEPNYVNSIGGGTNGSWQWIVNSFEWAEEACPNQILILNDYNNIEWPQDQSHFLGIVKTIQAAGAPIDAIGAQAHDLDHSSMTPSRVEMLMSQLHEETGLPIYITEMDISTSDDQEQLSKYQQYFPLFHEASYVPGITIWGWIYGKTWSNAPQSGLIRDGNFRPAMTWLMQELGRTTN